MARAILIWAGVALVIGIPLAVTVTSPLLAWRDPIYIISGFAGVAALGLMVLQPLAAAGALPGYAGSLGKTLHRWIGGSILVAILLHVAGLWITSPPDVVDALTFASPTPFSVWGVIAMWLVIATTALALLRRRLRLRYRVWVIVHTTFAAIIVVGSIAHAMLVDGTMEFISKSLLCLCLLTASSYVVVGRWRRLLPKVSDG